MRSLNYIKISGLPILRQLQLEEFLLRTTKNNWFIYNHDISSPTIVLGFSAKVHELIHIDEVIVHNVNTIRRYTGGGTVIVDKDTIFTSLIMNSSDVDSPPYPREIMSWSDKAIFSPAINSTLSHKHFSLRENDYIIEDKKVGGNAQSIVKDRWVHHTSFLWNYNPLLMQYLKMPKKRPEYRADRDHTEFLDKLQNYFESKEIFEDVIIYQLKKLFHISRVDINSVLESFDRERKQNPTLDIRTRVEELASTT